MELYHFRSVDSAIYEIRDHTLHFASPKEVNDPIDGYAGIYWQGDSAAWEGLLRNYVCSLYHMIDSYRLATDQDILPSKCVLYDIHGFTPTLHEESLFEPLALKKPHTIFVCSMADLFHEDVPFEFIDKVISTIQKTPWHRYQILTKRAQRMADYFSKADVPSNVWLGVTVENQQVKSRIDILRTMDAPVRFLSCEPLLEDLGELDLTNINWVIVGGESGVQARPMHPNWVKSIRDQAVADGIPFFFKQWGTWGG